MSDAVKVVMNWSSGKDAALAYHLLSANPDIKVTHLLTTLSSEHDRIFMHGVQERLLEMQAARMDLPLIKVKLAASPTDDLYKEAIRNSLLSLNNEGVSTAAYGDIFLEDLRRYREQQLASVGFSAIFPLWKKNGTALIDVLTAAGIEAVVVCVNEKCLGKDFLGRKVDRSFLADLPAGVDPCGENGEFHTFVYNAPFFKQPINIALGEIVHKTYKSPDGNSQWDTGFYFLDIFPV